MWVWFSVSKPDALSLKVGKAAKTLWTRENSFKIDAVQWPSELEPHNFVNQFAKRYRAALDLDFLTHSSKQSAKTIWMLLMCSDGSPKPLQPIVLHVHVAQQLTKNAQFDEKSHAQSWWCNSPNAQKKGQIRNLTSKIKEPCLRTKKKNTKKEYSKKNINKKTRSKNGETCQKTKNIWNKNREMQKKHNKKHRAYTGKNKKHTKKKDNIKNKTKQHKKMTKSQRQMSKKRKTKPKCKSKQKTSKTHRTNETTTTNRITKNTEKKTKTQKTVK